MQLGKNVKEVLGEGTQEFKESTPFQKATLGATAVALAFEWGLGNETAIGLASGAVLKATHNVMLTAVAGGGVSFAEQTAFGVVTSLGVSNFPKFLDSVRTRILDRKDVKANAPARVVESDIISDVSDEIVETTKCRDRHV